MNTASAAVEALSSPGAFASVPAAERLSLSVLTDRTAGNALAEDVRAGLSQTPKTLPPKHFYDERGSELFDAICETPEYYPTRTEQALLEAVADDIVGEARPTDLVELGSGAARKTRVLLDALVRKAESGAPAWPRYVPVDISAEMLVRSAAALLEDYPTLRVHGVVADYEHHLHLLPDGERRLIAFLGSTLGNFDQPGAIEFVRAIASGMHPGDRLLLGLDLVKSPSVLHAAYNDAAGITAEFNRNVLRVINRELDADFDPERFEHFAAYLPEQTQIEMSLRSRAAHTVDIRGLDMRVAFADGERLRTEISRKFTRASATDVVSAAGLEPLAWHTSPDGYFALLVAGLP